MQSNSYNTNGNNNQQTRTPDIDPRAILIKKYSNTKKNFTDELPKDIFEKLFSSEGSVCSDLYDPELDKDKQIISTIFKDNRITLEQKEQISKSILNGNYEIFNHYDKNSYNNSYNNSYSNNSYNNNNNNSKSMNDLNQTQNSLAKSKYEINLHRHKLPKPKFLELVGEQKLNNQNSATFVSRKDVRNEYIKRVVNSSPRRPKKPLLSPKSIKKDSKEFNYATELPKKIQSERQ